MHLRIFMLVAGFSFVTGVAHRPQQDTAGYGSLNKGL